MGQAQNRLPEKEISSSNNISDTKVSGSNRFFLGYVLIKTLFTLCAGDI
jgi:hypothetical protein